VDIILWIIGVLLFLFICLICYAALCIASDADAQAERDFDIFANARTCYTCAHHLGGGQCRLNAESECAEGGGFELWEAKNA